MNMLKRLFAPLINKLAADETPAMPTADYDAVAEAALRLLGDTNYLSREDVDRLASDRNVSPEDFWRWVRTLRQVPGKTSPPPPPLIYEA
jgi:hypothetical protein